MGSVNSDYRQIIERLLREYADFLDQDDAIQQELVFDREHDRYLLVETVGKIANASMALCYILISKTGKSRFSTMAQKMVLPTS